MNLSIIFKENMQEYDDDYYSEKLRNKINYCSKYVSDVIIQFK